MTIKKQEPYATILALRAANGGAQVHVDIALADGTREGLSVHTAHLSRLPGKGPIDEEYLTQLREAASLSAALEAGFRSLSVSRCSAKRLLGKLRAKGFSQEIAEQAVAEFAARGYLKEADGALREAERGLSKLWGNRRILMELKVKGYSDEGLEAAKDRLADEDEEARCRTLTRCRIGRVGDPGELRRAVSFLSRYGYPDDMIRRVLGV